MDARRRRAERDAASGAAGAEAATAAAVRAGDLEAVRGRDFEAIQHRVRAMANGPRQHRLVSGEQAWGFSRGPSDTEARTRFVARIDAALRAMHASRAEIVLLWGPGTPGKVRSRFVANRDLGNVLTNPDGFRVESTAERWRAALAVLLPSTGEWVDHATGEVLCEIDPDERGRRRCFLHRAYEVVTEPSGNRTALLRPRISEVLFPMGGGESFQHITSKALPCRALPCREETP